MTCRERDSDLLLFGLGELSFWRNRKTAWHLRSCSRCRARQRELAAVSGRIADALRPPGGGGGSGGGPGAPFPARPGWAGFSPMWLVLVLSVLLMTVGTIWFVRTHVAIPRTATDDGCRPDLPSDLCR